MYNPFGMNTARQGFGQQGFGQSLNFKGLETKLDKLEKGIAGLTEQFADFPKYFSTVFLIAGILVDPPTSTIDGSNAKLKSKANE